MDWFWMVVMIIVGALCFWWHWTWYIAEPVRMEEEIERFKKKNALLKEKLEKKNLKF